MASPKQQTFICGPFRRVRDTLDPFDSQSPDTLDSSHNCYLADTLAGGGCYSRPGTQRITSVSGTMPQAVYSHTALDGTLYNFLVVSGSLYRWTGMSGAPVDVTPVGVTINAAANVYFTSLNDTIIVNDGVNRPWIGTNLGGTPITGTYIDYDGAGGAWLAFGQPVVYTGAVFFILGSVGGVSARTTIAWSEPNQPSVGYQQTGYDNAWTLTQTSTEPLYTLVATNDALYYARYLSWGAITGAPNINFQNTATHDVVSGNIGCPYPDSVQMFLNYVYFADQNGRPHRFRVGGVPEPIWLQTQSNFSTINSRRTPLWSVVEPTLNVYLVGMTTGSGGGRTVFAFDAPTGIYLGTWSVGSVNMGKAAMLWANADSPRVAFLQENAAGTIYVWKLCAPIDAVWTDNAAAMNVVATSGRLGYSAETNYLFTQVRAIAAGDIFTVTAPTIALTATTSQQSVASLVGTTQFGGGDDAMSKVTWMLSAVSGRFMRVSLRPTITTAQFQMYRIEITAVEQGPSLITDY